MKPLLHLALIAIFTCTAIAAPPSGFAADRPGSGYRIEEKAGESIDILRDGKLLARYMTAHDPKRREETYKPFLHVFDPEGKAPITKGPGGAFTHHRGIFIGWNKIKVNGKTFDRWHMKGGEQVHEKVLAQKADTQRATFTSQVRWMGGTADSTIIEEERTLTFLPAPEPAYALIDMISKITAAAGETELGGDPEHAGLHFRPADEVDRSKTSYLYPVGNADPHKDRDYPWFGETFTLGGNPYSVVYLNHPENPRGGAISAYRDYGRFGAFWKATIPKGGSREFKARFMVVAGGMPSAEVIQEAWNDYTGKNEPVPKTTARGGEFDKSPDSKKKKEKELNKEAPKSALLRREEGKEFILAANTPAEKPAEPEPAVKRAGGGPVNPEIKFPLPPPPVLSPQEQMKTFVLPEGFKAELVASEPLIQAPIAISWDDQARMYVLEMRGYMHDVDGAGEDQPLGRITRLEDADDDGIYETSTVFADKLVMPRAVMAFGDGALVGISPNLIWFRDTDGDGVADRQEIMATDFDKAGGQPEHMANSPTWLMDNWIWCAKHGKRYRWQGGKLISESAPVSGQWGMSQDDWGRPFFNYNSALLHSHLVAPSYYARNPSLAARTGINANIMPDGACWPSHPTPGVNRGYSGILRDDGTLKTVTATCGAAIYRGDLFPKEFLGDAFVPEPSGNLVKRVKLSEEGGVVSGKNAYDQKEFLTSTDERFRPVNANVGPDGALYLVDMARGVIQHKGFLTYYLVKNIKERELEQPLDLGRIYRIVPEGSQPRLVKLPKETAAIVPFLAHANGWVRDAAQRVLVERGDASVAGRVQEVAAGAPNPQGRVQALWTLDGLRALTPEVVTGRFADPDEHVRAAAVRLADHTLAPELVKLADDPSPLVRLAVAFEVGAQSTPAANEAIAKILEKGGSPLLAEAVASGARGRELELMEALLKRPATGDAAIAKSGIFKLLADCLMNDRRPSRVASLIDFLGTLEANSPRQHSILEGMARQPKGRNVKVKFIHLEAAPAPLAAMREKAAGRTKSLLENIDKQLAWPDKPGVPPPPKIEPLTAEQQAHFDKGKTLYATICAACHQPNGAGLEGLAPPLLDSDWVLGPADRPIRIVTQGLTGPVSVAGATWNLEMPGLPIFSDEDVASIVTYMRREWEHTASPVSPAEVAKVRAAHKDRTQPWTAKELTENDGGNEKQAAR